MQESRRYRIFIPHAWSFHEYYRIKKFLNNDPSLIYSDYSVSKENALEIKGKKKLQEALVRRIGLAQIVLIIAGMEVNSRKFISFELETAYEMNKPIVGIIPRGMQRIPTIVNEYANEIVGWNGNSIVEAIYRNIL